MSSTTTSSSEDSVPVVPEDSPGSSVSTGLKDEYDELLKYAVVIPQYDPDSLPRTLSDVRQSFPQPRRAPPQPQPVPERHITISSEQSPSGSSSAETETQEEEEEEESRERQPSPRQEPGDYTTPLRFPMPSFQDEGHGSPGSGASTPRGTSPESQAAYSPSVDPDISRMEQYLDIWCGDLKRSVINELSRTKIRVIEHGRQELQKEKERHASEVNLLQNEIESMKELLNTYEQSIQRKDEVISNLTRGLQAQRQKYEMLKKFTEWKIRHHEMKREAFATNLARKHYHRGLAQKAWAAWHAIVEAKWRQRVEKACQAKAQEVCMALTNDYEARIASLNEALESSRVEVSRLHAEREQYEETMKKAFMRGVCALNLEAMTMFHEGEEQEGRPEVSPRDGGAVLSAPPSYGGSSTVIPQEPVYSSKPRPSQQAVPPHTSAGPRVVTSQGATSQSYTSQTTRPSASRTTRPTASSKSKIVTAKISAQPGTVRKGGALGSDMPMGLAPPMSSVIVERHQPVVKQTIGHATASRYPQSSQPPRQGSQPPGIIQRKIAGQAGLVHLGAPNIHTVKVVE